MYKPEEEELQAWCAEWQEILSLKHWGIQVKYERKHKMSAGCYAEVHCKPGILSAVIKILDPSDYDDPYIPQNIELSLLHELVHIPLMMFSNHEEGSAEDVLQEQFVESMSKALLRCKHIHAEAENKERLCRMIMRH